MFIYDPNPTSGKHMNKIECAPPEDASTKFSAFQIKFS